MKMILLCTVIIISSGSCQQFHQFSQSIDDGEGKDVSQGCFFSLCIFSRWRQSSGIHPSGSNCTCGWINNVRIVGGIETKPRKYPWMVLIYYIIHTDLKCGGAIITLFHVLTAAHCTYGRTESEISVYVGVHISKPNETIGQMFSVARIIQHKEFRVKDFINDISILITENKITFDQKVGPVCLPNHEFKLEGQQLKAMGWGDTKGTGNDNVLREVDLAFVPLKDCKNFRPEVKKKKHICTHGHLKNVCHGDSGGGVVYLNPETSRYTLVGLVSYVDVTCVTLPSVSTDVYGFKRWIAATISESNKTVKACTGD